RAPAAGGGEGAQEPQARPHPVEIRRRGPAVLRAVGPCEMDQVVRPGPRHDRFGVGEQVVPLPARSRDNGKARLLQRTDAVAPDEASGPGEEDAARCHAVTEIEGTAVTKRVPPARRSASWRITSALRFQGRLSTKSGCRFLSSSTSKTGMRLPGRSVSCLAGLRSTQYSTRSGPIRQ